MKRWMQRLINCDICGVISNIPYSVLSPQSFTLFASYWAFFFKRQALKYTTDKWSLLMHNRKENLLNQDLDYSETVN